MKENAGRQSIESLLDAYPRLPKCEQEQLCVQKYAYQQAWKQEILTIPEAYKSIVQAVHDVTKPFKVTGVQNNQWKKQRDDLVAAARTGQAGVNAVLELALKDEVYTKQYESCAAVITDEKKMKIHEYSVAYKKVCERLAYHNLRLVWKYAQLIGKKWDVGMEELFNEGFQGLCKAIECFNPEKKTQFSTYAVPRIIVEMQNFVEKDNHTVQVGQRAMDLVRKAEAAKNIFYMHAGRDPTLRELRAVLGISKEKFQGLLDGLRKTRSIDVCVGEEQESLMSSLGELKSECEEDHTGVLYERLLRVLGARERYIVIEHTKGRAVMDIARTLHKSRSYTSQKRVCAVHKLQVAASRMLAAGEITLKREYERKEIDAEVGDLYDLQFVAETRRILNVPKKKKKSYEIIAFLASQEAT